MLFRSVFDDLLRDVDRLELTVNDVLTLARNPKPQRRPHPLATALREASEAWGSRFHAAQRSLVVRTDDHLPWVQASPAAIRQILDVLLDNSLTHGTGTTRLSGTRVGNGAVVAVSDEAQVHLDRDQIFAGAPAASATPANGSGIGLPLARRLAEAEDLRLVLADAGPGTGVAFNLVFGATPGETRQT